MKSVPYTMKSGRKRMEDSSKSSHLDHYVAAGLASVSVLYILAHTGSIKAIHSMCLG